MAKNRRPAYSSQVKPDLGRNGQGMFNVHRDLPDPAGMGVAEKRLLQCPGDYRYCHYGFDGLDDRGWGCGYRTLQTICSWISENMESRSSSIGIPTLPDIQDILVKMEDKEPAFKGSRDWIGSFEVCLVVDHLFGVACKIIHVPNGSAGLSERFDALCEHFRHFGSPVMMGGDVDASSKGIFGAMAASDGGDRHLLVVDPHYFGPECTKEELWREGWVCWKRLEDFSDCSFYNLCLPQLKVG